jgi:hypothetical protein
MPDAIRSRIVEVRGMRVLVDADLARLYGVTTKRLNEQVKRNRERFPVEFVFRLTAGEKAKVVANCDHLAKLRYSSSPPYVFTEHGALMASAVLNTPEAVKVSVFVIRAFVQLRESLAKNRDIAKALSQLERKVGTHDRAIAQIFNALRQLTALPKPAKRRRIGFL